MGYNDRVDFRDNRTGQFRKARHWEKNRFFKVDTLSKGMAQFLFKSLDEVASVANDFADELVDYAVKNAPWDDRTGDARAGLQAAALVENTEVSIQLYHTIDYGLWLEVRWGARYAIIIPTIEQFGPHFFDKMQGMLGEITYYE